jgi:hypothetical protein
MQSAKNNMKICLQFVDKCGYNVTKSAVRAQYLDLMLLRGLNHLKWAGPINHTRNKELPSFHSR